MKGIRRSSISFALVIGATALVQLVAAQAPGQTGQRQGGGRGIQPALYPVLPMGSALPEFSLLGIDGRRHAPAEYAKSKALAVVFESNHCPASIAYEQRIHDLFMKYRGSPSWKWNSRS